MSINLCLLFKFAAYTSNPILLILQPNGAPVKAEGHSLPLKAYEPTVEIREHTSRTVFIEVGFSIEIGEAERIAVDWTAKGGEVGTSCKLVLG